MGYYSLIVTGIWQKLRGWMHHDYIIQRTSDDNGNKCLIPLWMEVLCSGVEWSEVEIMVGSGIIRWTRKAWWTHRTCLLAPSLIFISQTLFGFWYMTSTVTLKQNNFWISSPFFFYLIYCYFVFNIWIRHINFNSLYPIFIYTYLGKTIIK